jgi:hypothetical protein
VGIGNLQETLATVGLIAAASFFGMGTAQASEGDPSPEKHVFTPLFPVEAEDAEPARIEPAIPEEALNRPSPAKVFEERDPTELHALIPAAKNLGEEWHIYKTKWEEEDERGYQAFVTAIGRSRCFTLDDCLRDPANPYRDLNDNRIYLGDCADMAYFLRGYYAWKNGLPFSYQHQMRTADGSRDDLRYSGKGNVVTGRRTALPRANGKPVHAPSFLQRIGGEVSTAMFRTHPTKGTAGTYDDFYPVAIDRDHVVPGAIAYDVFGHVGLVYEVEADGRVKIVASHPDHSVTRSLYGANFMRTGPEYGGGLKAWRPIELVGATRQADGTYKGGKIVAAKNEELEGFSLEQYFGNKPDPDGDWLLGEFIYDNRTLDYYDYVRYALAAKNHAFNPITEMENAMDAICGDLRARKVAVDGAQRSKIHERKHPGRLPPNIYGTYGTWEAFSTPSRDARLKTSFLELRRMTETLVERRKKGLPGVDYQGDDLASDLLHTFDEKKMQCKITYKRMDGSYVVMNMAHVMERLFDMSFDPYHCPERRWGAKGKELSTCRETEDKARWYDAQQYLRNQVHRTYNVQMGFTLDELGVPGETPPEQGGIGVAAAPDINIKKYLLTEVKPHRTEELQLSEELLRATGATNRISDTPASD